MGYIIGERIEAEGATMHRSASLAVIVSAVILFHSPVTALADGNELTAAGLLDKYRETLDQVSTVYAIEAVTDETIEFAGKTQRTRYVYHSRVDHDRIDAAHEMYRTEGHADLPSSPQYRNRAIINERGEGIFYYGRGPGPVPDEVLFYTEGAKEVRYARGQMGSGRALDGYLANDSIQCTRLLEQSASLSVARKTEEVDGFPCYVLSAITDHGHYTLWLDPSHGYLPRRVSVKKRSDDVFDDKPLTTISRLSEVDFSMENVEIERKGQFFVPVSCDITEVWRGEDGSVVQTARARHKRTSVDLSPDFESLRAFEPDIPDGTRVSHQDFVEYGMTFEWQAGHVVPSFDDLDLEGMDLIAGELKASGELAQVAPLPRREGDGQSASEDTGEEHPELEQTRWRVSWLGSLWPLCTIITVLLLIAAAAVYIIRRRASRAR